MTELTLTLDDDLLAWLEERAALAGLAPSQWVGTMLAKDMAKDQTVVAEKTSTLEFRRLSDGVTYRFRPTDERNGVAAWKRVDLDVWLVFLPGSGWATVDASDTVNSRPWERPLAGQDRLPPLGDWVSRKGEKSYVYALRVVDPD